MKRTYLSLAALVTLCFSLLLISGCGSSGNKEGDGPVATVAAAACVTCHSTTAEVLTGDTIVASYTNSVHNLNLVGCQDCHGAGGSHNGVGPIPYPSPSHEQCQGCHDSGTATDYALVTQYSTSKHFLADTEDGRKECNRCHTHQGAVLSAKSGYTGDGNVIADMVGAPGVIADADPIRCNTCHTTHDAKVLRVDATWTPSKTVGAADASTNNQYRLCTQCHGYINSTAAGADANKLMGSGTTASGTVLVGHHETSWYRIIATTHYDDPATAAVEGYKMRFTMPDGTVNPNPCFDCHGHEAKTNTNSDPTASTYEANATIYTDWGKSGHARGLFAAKYAAAKANPVNTALPRTDPVRVAQGLAQVDAVMAASVTAGPFGGHNTGSCARCHSTEGFSYYFENLANIPVAAAAGVLKCYGCHSNPGAGTLRTLKNTKTLTNYTTDLGWNPPGYTLAYGKKRYPDVSSSNICISCHDSRQNDPAAVTATSNYLRAHYLQGAATMYVKMGFLELTDETTLIKGSTTTYRKSLMSDQDGGTITSTHRKLGTPAIIGDTHADKNGVRTFVGYPTTGTLANGGPCVTCHFGSHSQKIDQRAIDAVCSKCHYEEEGHSILTKAAFDQYFLEPQSEVFQDAIQLAMAVFNSKQNVVELTYAKSGGVPVPGDTARVYLTGTSTEAGAGNWAAVMTAVGAGYDRKKLVGAVSNISFFTSDPAAYAHARTYTRRLLYDSIDYLDDGLMNESVGATALATLPAVYSKNATNAFTDGTLTTLATGTSEAMVYLLKWSRSTGKWDTTSERP